MADSQEFYIPGGDGKWDNPELPDTLDAAHARIKALEEALGFYSNAQSYDPDSPGNEHPTHDELLSDQGLRARIGRVAMSPTELAEWLTWTLSQDRSL